MSPSKRAIGQKVAATRRARRYSQPELAAIANISLSTLRKIERGDRGLSDNVLDSLARALAVEPERLVGRLGPTNSRVHSAIPAIRHAVDSYDLPEDGPVRSLPELRSAVAKATRQRLGSQYSGLASSAPALLNELSRALQAGPANDRRAFAAMVAEAYRAADSVAYKFGYYDLSARMIEVMRWASGIAEDPVLLASIAYVRTEVFFASRNLTPALRALETAAELIPVPVTAHEIAAIGAIHMRAAVTAARLLEDPEVADGHMRRARDLAGRVPEGVYNGTAFGPESMRVHEVSVAVELGDGARAVAAVGTWTPSSALPAERRSHYFIDMARAHLWLGQREDAFRYLQEARQAAPQHVREHPYVRDALATLLRLHLSPAEQLISFAEWSGAV